MPSRSCTHEEPPFLVAVPHRERCRGPGRGAFGTWAPLGSSAMPSSLNSLLIGLPSRPLAFLYTLLPFGPISTMSSSPRSPKSALPPPNLSGALPLRLDRPPSGPVRSITVLSLCPRFIGEADRRCAAFDDSATGAGAGSGVTSSINSDGSSDSGDSGDTGWVSLDLARLSTTYTMVIGGEQPHPALAQAPLLSALLRSSARPHGARSWPPPPRTRPATPESYRWR